MFKKLFTAHVLWQKTSFQDHRKLIKLTATTFDYFLTKKMKVLIQLMMMVTIKFFFFGLVDHQHRQQNLLNFNEFTA